MSLFVPPDDLSLSNEHSRFFHAIVNNYTDSLSSGYWAALTHSPRYSAVANNLTTLNVVSKQILEDLVREISKMLGSITTALLLGLLSLISLCEAQALQVGLALRSDSIVLVQLADHRNINYSVRVDVDQDYRNFMTMVRHDQTDLFYLHEYDLYHQKYFPIYNRTLTHPIHPVTNFRYAHLLARNIRPLIKQAESELGKSIKCDLIVIPSYGNDHDFRPFVRLASELAGCGSLGFSQIPGLHRVVLFAYDLDMTHRVRRAYGYGLQTLHSLLIEIEPSHIRIGVINVMPTWVKERCAHSCDREVSSVAENFLKCVTEFQKHCLEDDGTSYSSSRRSKVRVSEIKKVFVSGTMESQQDQIKELISTQFGEGILDDMSFGIDTEILGAYGAARWARVSGEVDDLREYDTWDSPSFLDPAEFVSPCRGSADIYC